MVSPDGPVRIAAGRSVSVLRMGGPVGATSRAASWGSTSAGSQEESSKPGSDQPAGSRRASWCSPSYRLAAVTGPAAQRQEPSVATTSVVPSA